MDILLEVSDEDWAAREELIPVLGYAEDAYFEREQYHVLQSLEDKFGFTTQKVQDVQVVGGEWMKMVANKGIANPGHVKLTPFEFGILYAGLEGWVQCTEDMIEEYVADPTCYDDEPKIGPLVRRLYDRLEQLPDFTITRGV